MKKQSLNALAASYRADLLYYIERAKLGKCPSHWQAYCFGEIAAAKGTDAYPEDGDALLDELHRLVDTVPQITNREESAAEIAAHEGKSEKSADNAVQRAKKKVEKFARRRRQQN